RDRAPVNGDEHPANELDSQQKDATDCPADQPQEQEAACCIEPAILDRQTRAGQFETRAQPTRSCG
ncbi:MAG: hypothetical protein EA424_02360, partial [Planctomycetaceae bacterium]